MPANTLFPVSGRIIAAFAAVLSRGTVTIDAVKYRLNIYEPLSYRECRAKWRRITSERKSGERGRRKGRIVGEAWHDVHARAQCFLSGRVQSSASMLALVSTFANRRTGSFDRKYYLYTPNFNQSELDRSRLASGQRSIRSAISMETRRWLLNDRVPVKKMRNGGIFPWELIDNRFKYLGNY